MKYILFLFLFVSVLPLHAYQAGAANRTNFSAAQQSQAAQPNSNYRSFSNYNNRNWGRGVQTRTVQTEVAGTSAVDFDKNTPQKLVAKTQAASTPAKNVPAQQPAAKPTGTPAATTQAPANVDPAAMLQQVQGMVNSLGNMSGAANAPSGQAPAMPDLSALMGGAQAAPASAPAKK